MSTKQIISALVLIIVILGLFAMTPSLVSCWSELSGSGAIEGQFGDQFGMINALFSGVALIAVAWTLYYQSKELREQKEIHKETKDIFEQEKNLLSIQTRSMRKQAFETSFFKGVGLFTDQQSKFGDIHGYGTRWRHIINESHKYAESIIRRINGEELSELNSFDKNCKSIPSDLFDLIRVEDASCDNKCGRLCHVGQAVCYALAVKNCGYNKTVLSQSDVVILESCLSLICNFFYDDLVFIDSSTDYFTNYEDASNYISILLSFVYRTQIPLLAATCLLHPNCRFNKLASKCGFFNGFSSSELGEKFISDLHVFNLNLSKLND